MYGIVDSCPNKPVKNMPNPEQLAAAVKLGAEIVENNAPHVAAKLPGLIELSGKAIPQAASLLEPETRALIALAEKHTALDPLASVVLGAAEKSGVPLMVDQARIAAVRESLLGGTSASTDTALMNAFAPRTYAERRMFYGG